MTDSPAPRYSAEIIKPVRPPEIEGEVGQWHSRWKLQLRSAISKSRLAEVALELTARLGLQITLTQLSDLDVRLELLSEIHPLDAEAWPTVDSLLVLLDSLTGGIASVNDSPREWWRPFRENRG